MQHITCCCEALARQRYIFGKLFVEPKDISTALLSIPLSLYKRHRDTESVLMKVYGCTISLKAEVLLEIKLIGPK